MVHRLAPPLKDRQFSCGGALKHTKMVDSRGGGTICIDMDIDIDMKHTHATCTFRSLQMHILGVRATMYLKICSYR